MIIYLEGVHGSGKTEVIEYLLKNYKDILEKKFKKITCIPEPKPPENVKYGGSFEGELWFLNHHAETNKELLNSTENELLLVDRHPSHILLYAKVFVKLFEKGKTGFSEERYKELKEKYDNLIDKNIANGKMVFLYTDYEELKNRIIKRKRETKKEWNENDWEYLNLIKTEYDKWYGSNDKNIIKMNTSNLAIKKVAEKIISLINA